MENPTPIPPTVRVPRPGVRGGVESPEGVAPLGRLGAARPGGGASLSEAGRGSIILSLWEGPACGIVYFG